MLDKVKSDLREKLYPDKINILNPNIEDFVLAQLFSRNSQSYQKLFNTLLKHYQYLKVMVITCILLDHRFHVL